MYVRETRNHVRDDDVIIQSRDVYNVLHGYVLERDVILQRVWWRHVPDTYVYFRVVAAILEVRNAVIVSLLLFANASKYSKNTWLKLCNLSAICKLYTVDYLTQVQARAGIPRVAEWRLSRVRYLAPELDMWPKKGTTS